jgi:DNA repair exonuclease SbcCD nuclease subunit
MKGLGVRDPHLAELFDRATRRAFESLVDQAIADSVNFVVIAGDIFDREWKDVVIGHAFVRQIARLARANIRVVMIRGNHDAASVIARELHLPPGIAWLGSSTPETVDWPDLGVAVHGMSFKTPAVPDAIVHRYPAASPARFNIGLLHTSLVDRPSHDPYAPCSVPDLAARGYDYWALGHIHAREVVENNGFNAVFSGNLQGRSIRETGAKGATLVTVDDGRISAIEAISLDAARWALVTVDLTGMEVRERAFDAIRRALEDAASQAGGRPLAARIRLVGETVLADRLRAASEFHEEIQLLAATVSDAIVIERIRHETSLQSLKALALPMADLDLALEAALADPAVSEGVDADLGLLLQKLPNVPGLIEADREEVLRAARAMILARLEGGQ